MAFDIDVIKRVYSEMSVKIDKARELLGRPMTLSEKILYSHLWDGNNEKIFDIIYLYKLFFNYKTLVLINKSF